MLPVDFDIYIIGHAAETTRAFVKADSAVGIVSACTFCGFELVGKTTELAWLQSDAPLTRVK
jgi:hypothetical protein